MAVPGERKEDRSIGQLLKELTQESSTLLKQEVNLAKTEMSEKVSRVGTNTAAVGVGGAVALLGAMALVAALILVFLRAIRRVSRAFGEQDRLLAPCVAGNEEHADAGQHVRDPRLERSARLGVAVEPPARLERRRGVDEP